MFELSAEEFEDWRSQFGTSNKGDKISSERTQEPRPRIGFCRKDEKTIGKNLPLPKYLITTIFNTYPVMNYLFSASGVINRAFRSFSGS
jgi:hypothetical protein